MNVDPAASEQHADPAPDELAVQLVASGNDLTATSSREAYPLVEKLHVSIAQTETPCAVAGREHSVAVEKPADTIRLAPTAGQRGVDELIARRWLRAPDPHYARVEPTSLGREAPPRLGDARHDSLPGDSHRCTPHSTSVAIRHSGRWALCAAKEVRECRGWG